MARCLRQLQPWTAVLFDLDHFKSINDRFSYLQGDRVLQDFCTVVVAASRAVRTVRRRRVRRYVEALLELADEALYCTKASGRNRTEQFLTLASTA
ncbi:GGDEF domain-containing protein|nr:GGDEF domain-containing protein [Candidatus Pantoea persica]